MKPARIVVAVIAASLLAPATALASAAPTGTYKTKIFGNLDGTWTITFAKNGRYTVSDRGGVISHGSDTTSRSRMTFSHETGPGACAARGIYSFKRTGAHLKFTRITDSNCSGRSAVLAHTLTQVPGVAASINRSATSRSEVTCDPSTAKIESGQGSYNCQAFGTTNYFASAAEPAVAELCAGSRVRVLVEFLGGSSQGYFLVDPGACVQYPTAGQRQASVTVLPRLI